METLNSLLPGNTFEIPSLASMRSGVLLHSNPSGSTVSIEQLEGNSWSRNRITFANSVPVYVTGVQKLKADVNGLLSPDFSQETPVSSGDSGVVNVLQKRKRHTLAIIFPGRFTVSELAASLGVEPYVISNEMNRLKKTGVDFKKIGEVEKVGKGRRTAIYQLA